MPTHIKFHYEIKKKLHPGSWCIDLTLFHLKKKKNIDGIMSLELPHINMYPKTSNNHNKSL